MFDVKIVSRSLVLELAYTRYKWFIFPLYVPLLVSRYKLKSLILNLHACGITIGPSDLAQAFNFILILNKLARRMTNRNKDEIVTDATKSERQRAKEIRI